MGFRRPHIYPNQAAALAEYQLWCGIRLGDKSGCRKRAYCDHQRTYAAYCVEFSVVEARRREVVAQCRGRGAIAAVVGACALLPDAALNPVSVRSNQLIYWRFH